MIINGTERNYFKKHIPGYCSGVKELEFYFDSLTELLSNEWVNGWTKYPFDFQEPKRDNPEFYRFSLSDNLLICELKEGKEWYVIGYVKFPERLNLPKWIPNK